MKIPLPLLGAALVAPCLATTGPVATGPDNIAAGGSYQVTLDPAGYSGTWTIDWGDGTPAATVSTAVTTASHTYANKGVVKITATLATPGGAVPVQRTYTALVTKTRPALYYHFNNLSGTGHSGPAYTKTGTVYENIASFSANAGKAIEFGGAGHLDIPGLSAGADGSFLGLEFWLRADDLTTKQVIFAGKGTANGTPVVYIENGKLHLQIIGSGVKSIDLSPDVLAGEWHHYGISFERSRYFKERNTVRIYRDGYRMLDEAFPRADSLPLSYTGATIGARDTGSITNRLDGALDEVVLHPRGIYPGGIYERHQAATAATAEWNVAVGVTGSGSFTVTEPSIYHATPVVELELDPDPAVDNQPRIQAAIDTLQNGQRLRFVAKDTKAPGGTYHLRTSVWNPTHTRHFTITGKADIEIDGNGAELITHKGVTKFLNIFNSDRIAVRNLTFDIADDSWRVGTYAQVLAVRPADKQVDIRFVKGAALTPDTTVASGIATWRWRSVDATTRVPNMGGFIIESGGSATKTINPADTSLWTYTLNESTTSGCWAKLSTVMATGDLLQMNNAHFGGSGLIMNGCEHVTLDGVNFHAITGMVALTGKNDYVRVANCRIGLKPGLTIEDKPFSSASDGFHFDSGGGHVIFENNDVALTDDDPVAIKDGVDRNCERLTDTTLRVGKDTTYNTGTVIELRSLALEALSPPFTAVVTARVQNTDHAVLTLDRNLPGANGSKYHVLNDVFNVENWILRDNHFHDISGRLMLYTGRGTLEGNRISRMLTHIGFSATSYDAGGRPYDVLVRGNYHEHGSGDILPWEVSPGSPITEDIAIIGNSHYSSHWDIQFTDRPVFMGNYFEQVDGGDKGNRGLVETWKSRDVRFVGNVHYDPINLNWTTSEKTGDTTNYSHLRDNTLIATRDIVIVDNGDASPRFTRTGTWGTSSYAHRRYHGTDYLWSSTSGATATFTPDLPAAGAYDVYAIWNGSTDRGNTVPYLVTHAGGTTTVTASQRSGDGRWVKLGTFNFAAGTAGSVKVSTTGAGGTVIADAIRFER